MERLKNIIFAGVFKTVIETSTYCKVVNWLGCKRHLVKDGCKRLAHYSSGQLGDKEILAFSFGKENAPLTVPNEGNGRFGYLSYELKVDFAQLESHNPDDFNWSSYHFFDADLMVIIQGQVVRFKGDESLFEKYVSPYLNQECESNSEEYTSVTLYPTISKTTYLQQINAIKHDLQMGNIYEINFCQNFKAQKKIDPLGVAHRLFELSDAPFSSVLYLDGKWIICGSPERFLKRTGNKLISQPIKGTAKRDDNQLKDGVIKEALRHNQKERSENYMIVDLVRNDLSKLAIQNTVEVEELCQLYSFKTVHQLISTITCMIDDQDDLQKILKATFPMGSMTGAPKHRVMKLIDKYEDFKRGVYSGAVGYLLPDGDFDFNVVIRSVLYDENTHHISAPVGGAITIESDPESEYEECMLKLAAMQKALL